MLRAASKRVWVTIRNQLSDQGLQFVLISFVILRVVMSVWVWWVRSNFGGDLSPHPILRPYVGVPIEHNPWLEPWQRWDTLHYQAISERGYTAFDSAAFTPPLYPLLMRWVGGLFSGNTLLAGMLISNLAFVGMLVALFRYTLEEVQDVKVARRTVFYMVSAPAAFFFLAAYTESMFLFCAILSLLALKREQWLYAGIFGGLASLTRLPGVLLVLPMVYAAWVRNKEGASKFPWISPILTLIGAAIFPLYLYLRFNLPLWTPISVQAARTQGKISFPGANILEAIRRILSGTNYMSDIWDVLLICIFLVLAFAVWQKLSRISSLYYLPLLVLYLVREGGTQPLLGMARYVLVLFPGFIILGIWGSNRWIQRFILYPSWLLLLFMSGQFAIWGWVG